MNITKGGDAGCIARAFAWRNHLLPSTGVRPLGGGFSASLTMMANATVAGVPSLAAGGGLMCASRLRASGAGPAQMWEAIHGSRPLDIGSVPTGAAGASIRQHHRVRDAGASNGFTTSGVGMGIDLGPSMMQHPSDTSTPVSAWIGATDFPGGGGGGKEKTTAASSVRRINLASAALWNSMGFSARAGSIAYLVATFSDGGCWGGGEEGENPLEGEVAFCATTIAYAELHGEGGWWKLNGIDENGIYRGRGENNVYPNDYIGDDVNEKIYSYHLDKNRSLSPSLSSQSSIVSPLYQCLESLYIDSNSSKTLSATSGNNSVHPTKHVLFQTTTEIGLPCQQYHSSEEVIPASLFPSIEDKCSSTNTTAASILQSSSLSGNAYTRALASLHHQRSNFPYPASALWNQTKISLLCETACRGCNFIRYTGTCLNTMSHVKSLNVILRSFNPTLLTDHGDAGPESILRSTMCQTILLRAMSDFRSVIDISSNIANSAKNSGFHVLHASFLLSKALSRLDIDLDEPTASLPPILECLALCNLNDLDGPRAEAMTLLARARLGIWGEDKVRSSRGMLEGCLPVLLRHGHIWFQGEGWLTLAKCDLVEAKTIMVGSDNNRDLIHKDNDKRSKNVVHYSRNRVQFQRRQKRERLLRSSILNLTQAAKSFRDVGDSIRECETFYLLSIIFDMLGDRNNRNKSAMYYRDLQKRKRGMSFI